MPKCSYDDFERVIAQYQAPPTAPTLCDLIASTIAIDADDVDEQMTEFARSRIELAYRTGNVRAHLHHLYDVLAVVESKMAQG